MTGRRLAFAFTFLASACSFRLDEALRADGAVQMRTVAESAPSVRYELAVIVPGDQAYLNRPVSFGERVGRAMDDLLRERGVQPVRIDDRPKDGARWTRLTLIHGRRSVDLTAEEWTGDRVNRVRIYTTGARNPRADVGALLDRLLRDVAAESPDGSVGESQDSGAAPP